MSFRPKGEIYSTISFCFSMVLPILAMIKYIPLLYLDKSILLSPASIFFASKISLPCISVICGGVIRCQCFTLFVQSGRAHKLAGFDLVEYSWAVFAAGTAGLPTDANDARLARDHSSRASFLLATGTNNTNKILVIFFRWAKSKNAGLDGPWNGPFSTPVL